MTLFWRGWNALFWGGGNCLTLYVCSLHQWGYSLFSPESPKEKHINYYNRVPSSKQKLELTCLRNSHLHISNDIDPPLVFCSRYGSILSGPIFITKPMLADDPRWRPHHQGDVFTCFSSVICCLDVLLCFILMILGLWDKHGRERQFSSMFAKKIHRHSKF